MPKQASGHPQEWNNVAIRREKYRLAKVAAAKEGKPLGEWMAEAIDAKLKK